MIAAGDDCGFSKYKPRRISGFADRLAIFKLKPQYPPATEAKGISGIVQIMILVNKDGLVELTCPIRIPGSPEPDRNLTIASEAAALQWVFQPNFGFTVIGDLKLNYVEDVLVFEFGKEQGKRKEANKTKDLP
jgi:hypothetical protein